MTAAKVLRGLPLGISTQVEAATAFGSNVHYVEAAITILRSEDETLLEWVCRGDIPLVKAAAAVKRRAELITALRQASTEDRVIATGRVLGVDEILDIAVAAEAAR
jgi:hypothetical protein